MQFEYWMFEKKHSTFNWGGGVPKWRNPSDSANKLKKNNDDSWHFRDVNVF